MLDKKMKTGEFAKLCHVDKKTLFYYDEIGLLKPAIRLENGYRYYTIAQFDQMNTIKILQFSGLSLEAIATILKTNSYQDRCERLSMQINALTQKIEALNTARTYLQGAVSNMQSFLKQKADCIFEEEQETTYYKIYPMNGSKILGYLSDGYEYGVMYDLNDPNFLEQQGPKYCFHTGNEKDHNHIKTGGRYICMFHLLAANEIKHNQTIHYFCNLVQSKQIKTTGMIYYEGSCGEFFIDERNSTLMKLSIKIKD